MKIFINEYTISIISTPSDTFDFLHQIENVTTGEITNTITSHTSRYEIKNDGYYVIKEYNVSKTDPDLENLPEPDDTVNLFSLYEVETALNEMSINLLKQQMYSKCDNSQLKQLKDCRDMMFLLQSSLKFLVQEKMFNEAQRLLTVVEKPCSTCGTL